MWALDQVKNFFTGDVKIDDPEIRQALKNAFPNLAKAGSEFDDLEYLPAAYVKTKIVPALMTMDEARLQAFKVSIEKTSSDLHSLAKDVESNLRYKPRNPNAQPWADQSIPDRLSKSGKAWIKSMEDFMGELTGLRSDAEREQALMAEIVASANRSVIKFDRYVNTGNDWKHGNKAFEWYTINSMRNTQINKPAPNKQIEKSVENVPRSVFIDVVNSVVAMAQEPSNDVIINGQSRPVGDSTRIAKLAFIASWLSALEAWCDRVLPSLVSEAARKTVTVAADGTFWVVGEFGWVIWDEYPVPTVIVGWLLAFAGIKTGNLVKHVANSLWTSVILLWKAGSYIPVVKKISPFIEKFWEALSIGNHFSKPAAWTAWSSSVAWTPWANPEWPPAIPEVTEKIVTIKGKEYYNPKSDSYKELETAVRNKIEGFNTVTPAVGTPGNPGYVPEIPAISQAEANTRLAKALRFIEDYKTDFLNGKAPYDKTKFELKLDKITTGGTVVIPVTGSNWEKVKGIAGKAVSSPLVTAREATALTREWIAGKGWNLNARMAAVKSAEDLTAGSKNEPFKVDGVTDGYTFKWDHAKVSAEMKEIENLLKERAAVEKWLQLESEITAKSTQIIELKRRIADLKSGNSYFKTSSQTTTSLNAAGNPINQSNTTQDLTDTAKDIEKEITEISREKSKLEASAQNSTEYKRVFKLNRLSTLLWVTLTEAGHEFTRLSQEITGKVNSSYNTANAVASGNPNKFRENERGININKFLKLIAESMKK